MNTSEMRFRLSRLWRLGFDVTRTLAEQIIVQFLDKSRIRRLGEHGLLLQDREHAHRPLHHVDTSLQIHPKVLENPVESFPLVLFLFQDKHVMVEELLEFLVRKVDAQLLETVVL